MTDDDLAVEWDRLAKMRCGDMSDDDVARLIAVDRESVTRKYKSK